MKINKFKWDAEGFPEMVFTADYLQTIYDNCNNDCDHCTLGKQILNHSTTPCLVITQAKIKLANEIKKIL